MKNLFFKKERFKFSFTLIEIIVVVTIISLLLSGSFIGYKTLIGSSVDTRRKTDIETIKTALELYRNNNSSYPITLEKLKMDNAGRVYLKSIPVDPKTETNYFYNVSPAGCDEVNNPCSSFTLSAVLENGKIYQADQYGTEVISP